MRPGDPASVRRHPTRLPADGSKRRRWLVTVPLAVVLVFVTWVLAFGLSRDPDAYRSPLIGRSAPSFALPSLDGSRTVRLSDFRGQVLVVNFWASWCADCVVEHPALAQAWQRYRDQGVVVLGVVYQDQATNARRFLRDHGGDWPEVEDPGSRAALAFGVRGVPETFVVAPDGTVMAQHSGAVTYAFLSEQIARAMKRSV